MKALFTLLLTVLVATHQAVLADPQPTATSEDFIEAMIASSQIKTAYAETYQTNGTVPQSLQEIGVSEAMTQNENLLHSGIDPFSGSIMLGLSPKFGQNAWVALVPTIDNYTITRWTCQTTVINAIAAESGCRGDLSFEFITRVPSAALFSETVINFAPVRTSYAESYQSSGEFPTSLEEIGVDDNWLKSVNADHAIIDPHSHSILIGLSPVFGTNEWFALTPRVNYYGNLSWRCRTTLSWALTSGSGCWSSVSPDQLLQ